jgi:hypothetical protein
MPMEVLFAGVRVRELGPATDWYSRLFGREADIVPNDQEVMWRVSDGGWLYVIEDPGRAGKSLVTIAVSDIDTEVADLAGRDISMGAIEPVGDAARKATVEDLDGNSIAIIQVNQ